MNLRSTRCPLLLGLSFFVAADALLPKAVYAETRTTTALTPEAVWDAITAAKDGDIVQLPEGTAVWKSGWNAKHWAKMKAITIRGAGIDKTIIRDETSTGAGDEPFDLKGVGGKPFRITGITFAGDDRMVLAWPHPADHQPADWTLSMSEVTAYGAAWRRGDSWLLPPNPIPIDYVTRAAFLWRGGECYRFDDRANPPLCWVSCGGSRGLSPAAAPAGPVAQRLLPVVFLPGEPLTVAIDIQPSEGTGAYAVEDAIPPGWAITAISNDGEYDGASGRVKWGPFFDSLPRTLSYQVTPPRTTSDPASFTGVSSFDGVSVPIAGQRELGEGCRLHVGTQPISGQFELTFAGRAGANFVLETSSDLISWTPWTTVSNAHGGLRFFTLIQPDTPRCFFRARLLR